MISSDNKGVNNRHVWFGSTTILGKGHSGYSTLWLSRRKRMVKILIGCKCCVSCVKNLNEKILKYFFCSLSSATNEPNFKIVCNCIHELLNIFEDPAQRIHTIVN